MTNLRVALIALSVLVCCQVAAGQAPANETELVRQAVQAYLATAAENSNDGQAATSNVVHPRAKVISRVGDELSIRDIKPVRAKRKGEPVKLESVDRILSVDVTGSMAVVKVETEYPNGSLTAAEAQTLPPEATLRSAAGQPIRISSYLSLLKIGGEWKIVSFLISADVTGDK